MPKQVNLPPGEMHLLTIDRVVERDCSETEPDYWYCEECGWVHPQQITNDEIHDRCQNPVHCCYPECHVCHGTGKRPVRLRGHVEIKVNYIGAVPGIQTADGHYNIGNEIGSDYEILCEAMRSSIIAAWLDGTLPQGVAVIEEVDADGRE